MRHAGRRDRQQAASGPAPPAACKFNKEASDVRCPDLFQRRRLHARGEGDPGPQGLARGLCPCRGARRLAHRDRREPRGASSPRPTASISPPPAPTASPTSSTAAGRRDLSKSSTRPRIAFADYSGNRQYITQGNLSENPKAHIFVMDYAHRRRVKIWGEARVVEDDPALTDALMPKGYKRAARTGDPVQDRGLGHQLPAAHPAKIRRGGCRRRARRARRADRGP